MLALLTLTISSALAAVPGTTAYHVSSHPMISGTVVMVNDHQMVVDTDQGEQVTLELDTRTMAPRDLAPGMVMRADFEALEDCRFYAQRILPLRDGASAQRLQAYANTSDSREAIANSTSSAGSYRGGNIQRPAVVEDHQRGPLTIVEPSPGTVMTAKPATADYQFSTRPMITGSVVSVNDHRLVVATDQGQQLGLVMDSHTVVPGDVGPGSVVRAEFTRMKDGRYYVKRVSRTGTDVIGREQAYAHTRDSNFALAQNTSDCGYASAPNTATSAVDSPSAVASPDAVVTESAPPPVTEPLETLPQTASNQSLFLVFGLLALGSAGLISVARALRLV